MGWPFLVGNRAAVAPFFCSCDRTRWPERTRYRVGGDKAGSHFLFFGRVEMKCVSKHIRLERLQAISMLEDLAEDCDDEECESRDYPAMSNEELEAEICLSGLIHDFDLDGVFD